MNIIQIYKQFPDHKSCIKHLEGVRWDNIAKCPYCNSINTTIVSKELRHHCNNCNTSFSVTVGTIFHKTKLDLQKWFLAISLVLNAKKGISSRQLARDIEVTKDTAWYMLMRLRRAMIEYGDLLEGIIEVDETYIGRKSANKHKNKRIKGTQGRNTQDKTAVIGTIQRKGIVKAQKVKDVSSKTINTIINRYIKKGSIIMTDEWKGYNKISAKFTHKRVNHSKGNYVIGIAHTNTIENFWSLFSRGIMGQYHHITDKYINKYLVEFCYR